MVRRWLGMSTMSCASGYRSVSIRVLTTAFLSLAVLAIAAPAWAAEHAEPEPQTGGVVCLMEQCVGQKELIIGGTVLAVGAAGTAAAAYAYGPEAALAAGGGFLLFGHFLFDVVPIGLAGAAAWFYGPEVWNWVGFAKRDAGQEPAR